VPKEFNWLRALAILGAALTLLAVLIAYGKSPLGWVIPSASAGEAALTWTAPTKRCDGTALTNLAGYSLTYGQAQVPLPLAPLAYTVTGLAPGTWWFSLAALDDKGERSEFITITKTVLPVDFKTSATVAYTLVKGVDKFVLLPVGTVPLGTQCDATNKVNGMHVVPRASVVWSGTIKPDVVVAQCS